MTMNEELKRKRAIEDARERLASFKRISVAATQTESERKEFSAEILPDLIDLLGVNGATIRFEFDGKELAAKVSQGDPGQKWDVAPLMEYLKENKLWNGVKTEILDPDKLHARIQLGDIKKADVEKFMLPIDPAKPSVKWVSPTPDSL